jgi:drug/metabolite transporter (DMT)-like permease
VINVGAQRYALFALLAAALFGASTPFAKLLLGQSSPWLLAGLLYLGSGLGLALLYTLRQKNSGGARLAKGDWRWLAGATLTGGVMAPILLLWGLSGTHAASASLLLNLEGVITTAVAAWLFHESVSRRVWLGSAVMLVAGLMLSWQSSTVISVPALAVVGACLCWAIDNNLTRRVSTNDPVLIAMIKGLVAGSVNTAIAIALGMHLPPAPIIAGALALGFFSYGISLVLFIVALRHLGSARTGAHFSTAPFMGAGIALLIFSESISVEFWLATALMIIATWLVLSEQHDHQHTHEVITHAHTHRHDEHHQHDRHSMQGEPHSHLHTHDPLTHQHAHLPDIHHRHPH